MSFKNCLIVVPMKSLDNSKSRIEKYISKEIKNKIVLKLFCNTLSKINKVIDCTDGEFNLAVLTNCDEIIKVTRKKNIPIIKDKFDHSLSESIQFAADWAVEKKYLSICIFPADIACINVDEIKTFIFFSNKSRSAIISPSYDLGTNALYISPPNAIKFNYGEKSFLSHIDLASNAGLNPVILYLDSIKYDVDNINDLKKLFDDFPNFIEGYSHE